MSDRESNTENAPAARGTAREVALLATRLGATAFGGPAAHIAILQDEIVHRRGWLGQTEFNHMLGLTNLLPGPNSTEMVMHAGYTQAGYRGLLAAGLGFILPGASLTLLLAVAYQHWGSSQLGQHFLLGVQAAVVAVLVQALWRLMRTVDRQPLDLAGIAVITALALAGLSEIPLLIAGGALLGAIRIARRRTLSLSAGGAGIALMLTGIAGSAAQAYSPGRLFFAFLKIGGLLYGSGYVLVSLLDDTFAQQLGWLTSAQVVDAIAAGQMTPGPLFTSATFIGYEVGGFEGAAIATFAIFLPAFVFVAAAAPLLRRISRSPDALDILHGISVAAIALLLAVTLSLGRASLDSATSAVIAVCAGFLLMKFHVNAALVIISGGALAILLHAAGLGG